MSRAIAAGALALAFLASGIQTRAQNTTDVWQLNGDGIFGNLVNWSPQVPIGGDSILFTNNNVNFTVSLNGSDTPEGIENATISNVNSVITIDASGNNFYVTNEFNIGQGTSTSTVYLAGGTLWVDSQSFPYVTAAQLRVSHATTNLYYSQAALWITNGTVIFDVGEIGADSNSCGTVVVSGHGVFDNLDTPSYPVGTLTVGAGGAANSQLIISNGGLMTLAGTITVGNGVDNTNCAMVLTDPGSVVRTTTNGWVKFAGNGGTLIISNKATLYDGASLVFGQQACYNTGVVDGATVFVGGSMQVGLSSSGATGNFFVVQNGGSLVANAGTFAIGNNSFNVQNGFQMGGTGLKSTGAFLVVRSAANTTNHFGNFLTFTNSFSTMGFLELQGPQEIISILGNATVQLTNSLNVGNKTTNCYVTVGNVPGVNILTVINSGTLIDLLTADNGGGMTINNGTLTSGDSLIITNGGVLLTSAGTISGGSPYTTGIVYGVGSVWSNYIPSSTVTPIPTNFPIVIGAGQFGRSNYFAVLNGAMVYNSGSMNIGQDGVQAINQTVAFGGPGFPSVIINNGSLNIGATSSNYGNVVTITNAVLNAGTINVGVSGATNNLLQINGGTISYNFMRVRPTNTIVFGAGSIEAGASTVDQLANNGSAFVVGDGVDTAYYDMTASGSGFHNFGSDIVVSSNAWLRGSGTLVGGAVWVYGSFSPGFSVGSIFVSNNLTFEPSAELYYDLGTNANGSDTVTVNGNLELGGTLNVNSLGYFIQCTNYLVFTYAGSLTNVGTLTVGSVPIAGPTYVINTNTVGSVILQVGGCAAPVDPFVAWQETYGLTNAGCTVCGGNASYTGDGMSNTNKFLAGFNPTSAAAYLHIISVARVNSGHDIQVTYLGANGDSHSSLGSLIYTNILDYTTGTASGGYSNINFTSTGQMNILSGGNGSGMTNTLTDSGGATAVPSRYYRIRVLVP
ncbi:MAG: hypothetical protein ABSA12_16510 [Verrucomicrobiia bacterium]